MNCKGQVIIECFYGFMLFAAAVIGVFYVSQTAAARLWLDHQLYQALVCVAQGQSLSTCQTKAIKLSKIAITRDVRFHLSRTPYGARGTYEWIGLGALSISNQMNLSLEKSRRGLPLWRL